MSRIHIRFGMNGRAALPILERDPYQESNYKEKAPAFQQAPGCCVDFGGVKFRKINNSLTLGDSLYKGNISSEKEVPD